MVPANEAIAPEPAPTTSDPERLVGAERVIKTLLRLAEHPGGIVLGELARELKSPKSTIHRALVSLQKFGLAVQDGRGHYTLGDEFLRVAFAHHEQRPEHVRVAPTLKRLANTFGETAHYAVLIGDEVIYRAKVDPPAGSVKLTSTVGGRNPAHSTAVGKLLLAQELQTLEEIREWIKQRRLEKITEFTKVTPSELYEDFQKIRARGYSLDLQENSLGINCIAVPVYMESRQRASGAISISALSYRTPINNLIKQLSMIKDLVDTGLGQREL